MPARIGCSVTFASRSIVVEVVAEECRWCLAIRGQMIVFGDQSQDGVV